jgi:hypothetical protein
MVLPSPPACLAPPRVLPLPQVDATLGLFDDLQEQHAAVATKTQTLHDACERLVQEKERLVEFADALRTKLNYFDELEKVRCSSSPFC